ncbi:hypothetical protein Lp19_1248 [Lactiplantibacillus plantarum]|uniref:Uncharacterized protein n=1 Tax=Lactiplantibacillus plantarum TaxID=1590 RepID=A0A162F198_LACPN|nr:hypothetical protein [Lactiplantibacillus plantarum]KZU95969.1 hypothetical protein Lp19_1248 [Lactiplantibacillus plantarum]
MNKKLKLVYSASTESDGVKNVLAVFKESSKNTYYLSTMDGNGHFGPGFEMNQDTFTDMLSKIFEIN